MAAHLWRQETKKMNWEYIEHFTRDEFGHADGVEPDWDLVMRLDQARAIAEIPFVITSGIRSDEHNAMVGGSPSSSHLTGNAPCCSTCTGTAILGR